MGKILKFRSRGPLPEVEERLAFLSDELSLTSNFADAMIREGHYRAAVAVIDEQRMRLADAETKVARAFALPAIRRRRTHAAAAGLAAALLIGSAAFASLGLHSGRHAAKPAVVLQNVQERTAEANGAGSSDAVIAAVSKNLDDLASITGITFGDATNPSIKNQITSALNEQASLLLGRQSAHNRALLLRIQKLLERVRQPQPDAPKQPSTKTDPNSVNPSAPPTK